MHCLWNGINLIVNSLAFDIEDKWLLIVSASEGELLLELLVTVGSEHYIDSLSLTWK